MARTQMLAAGQKTLAKGSESVAGAEQKLAELREFEGLAQEGTGGPSGYLQGILPSFMQTDRAQRLEQLSSGLARANRIPGEGTISDFDAKQFLKMTGGIDKSPATNRAFVQASRAAQKAAVDRQAFNEAFLQANGTTIGADTLWRQYSNANTLFNKQGEFVGDKRPSWGQYFATRGQQALRGEDPDLIAQVRAEQARRARKGNK
jgi:hypothetical protein